MQPTPNLKKLIVFIDGGYLRRILEKFWEISLISDPRKFASAISTIADMVPNHDPIDFFYVHLDTIRIYYYDAIVSTDDQKYPEFRKFFEDLKLNYTSQSPLELKFGRLIKGKDEKYRQKGVDVLLSTDLVVKTFQNHYDLAMIITGDDDFLDAVKIVKDFSGKQIIGLYNPRETSTRLIDCFDYKLPFLPEPLFKK
jgi:uncharacterized LabA/DUF88 family protein